jgi:hypothetical protein
VGYPLIVKLTTPWIMGSEGRNANMSDVVDVAIVGAGPYGLSLAAHLRAADVDYRQFGVPMRLWQAAMPRGMFLKSGGFASNLSDPEGAYTLGAFCEATRRAYGSYGVPVMRFVFGCRHAALAVSRQMAGVSGRKSQPAVAAGR